jgi:hypothetical protein
MRPAAQPSPTSRSREAVSPSPVSPARPQDREFSLPNDRPSLGRGKPREQQQQQGTSVLQTHTYGNAWPAAVACPSPLREDEFECGFVYGPEASNYDLAAR